MADAIAVEFDESVQSLEALTAAAYRLLDSATCQIEQAGTKIICRLTPKSGSDDRDAIRLRFLDCVIDENVRRHLASRTEPLRNLILSLAFGALANDHNATSD